MATGESEPHEEVVIPLWTAQEPGRDPAAASLVKHQEVAHDWELAPLKLPVGSVITFYADARDFDAIKGPNVGKSREMRLRIVSKEDAARQFDDARRELREEIARVLTMQKQAITPVENAVRTLRQTDRLPPAQRDDLNNAGMIQRQVDQPHQQPRRGPGARIRRMLDDLRNFKIANPDAQKQMEDMLARVGAIRDRNLGPAEQGSPAPSRASTTDCAEPRRAGQPATANAERADRLQAAPASKEAASKGKSERAEASKAASERGPAGNPKAEASKLPAEGAAQGELRRPKHRRCRRAERTAMEAEACRSVQGCSRGLERPGSPTDPTASRRSSEAGRRSREDRAGRGQDEPEGDRRRAPEDAR